MFVNKRNKNELLAGKIYLGHCFVVSCFVPIKGQVLINISAIVMFGNMPGGWWQLSFMRTFSKL